MINSLLNFNHHVSFGDGAGGDSGDNNDDENSSGKGRNSKKYWQRQKINRFIHVITHIPHDGCLSGIDVKLLEGIYCRRACVRMAPITFSAKLSTETATKALRMLPNVKGWKPTRANVGHYWTSYWSNYASNINERYFNLLA
ncbi:hypothetical protein TYRP_023279 [Tyrophagus putrescentiae]|nr:hypothetical protein TYRP_023279 [Tyrophagus putrescentiae]